MMVWIMLHREKCGGQVISTCAALFTQWRANALIGLAHGCNARLTVVHAIHVLCLTFHHLTTQCSLLCRTPAFTGCFICISCKFVLIMNWFLQCSSILFFSVFVHPPLFSICLSTERAVFSHWSLGSGLITYLFGLSSSKLLALCFAENWNSPPSPPIISIPIYLTPHWLIS